MQGARFLCAAVFVLGACLLPAAADAAAVAGASSLPVAEAASIENRTNGKVFGFDPVDGPYTCSGTALATPSGSIVLTAGHCVVEGGHWGRDIRFVPAYDHGSHPYGTFVAEAVYTMPQWRRSNNPDFDVAAIRVRPNELGTLAEAVGGREWTTGRSRRSRFVANPCAPV